MFAANRYAVERLLRRRVATKQVRTDGGTMVTEIQVVQYEVRWEGYDENSDSWVDEADITTA